MKITTGLFDHMVLQRNARNVSKATITGSADSGGILRAEISGPSRTKARDIALGRIRPGAFRVILAGLPAGGPYDIVLAVAGTDEHVRVRDVCVGDVWLLGGQSNMQGVGQLKDAGKADPLVRAFYMDDRWDAARDPIHNLWDAVDPVHADLSGGAKPAPMIETGVGPGVPFAQQMRLQTGVPQGLIACAHGGTCMTQWDPKLRSKGDHSLYGALLRRFHKNGGRVAGLAWYQGCSDANEVAALSYTTRMRELIAALRRDTGDRRLPVVIVQIARVIGWPDSQARWWNNIQEQERHFAAHTPACALVPAIDLQLDDMIHIGGRGQSTLGRRIAYAMQVLRLGRRAGYPPIAFKDFEIATGRNGATDVIVKYCNVIGDLMAGGRPAGFEVVLPDGSLNYLYDIELKNNTAILHSILPPERLAGAALHYGCGYNPFCNIVDAANRSLPVMGPIQMHKPKAITPFVRTLRVSEFQPGAGKLHRLSCPETSQAAKWATRTFPADFCDLHLEIGPKAPQDLVVYYACSFVCEFKMELTLLLGYDGPVKAWLDGREVFHDPAGINPAFPGRGKVNFSGGKGSHEVVVALGTNNGKAWGIFLALERRGVQPALVARGAGSYAMPVITG